MAGFAINSTNFTMLLSFPGSTRAAVNAAVVTEKNIDEFSSSCRMLRLLPTTAA